MLSEQKTLLIVDDDSIILLLIHGLLKDTYRCVPLRSGQDALHFLEQNTAHLVLLDLEMPGMNGLETARAIRALGNQSILPLVLLTGSPENVPSGADGLFADILRKPIQPIALRRRVAQQLELTDLRRQMDTAVQERVADIKAEEDLLITLFANLAEYRDQAQGEHIQRTAACVRKVILGFNRLFPERNIEEGQAQLIVVTSQLHDVGKIGIPDAILLKPGKLTPEEFDIMKKHTTLGSRALAHPNIHLPSQMLSTAQQIALCHHEKWDGSGYPQGLRGEQIPLCARIVTLVDVLDALLSIRPYRKPLSFTQAVQSVVEGRGKHFDPDLVDAFLDQKDAIEEIHHAYNEVR